MAWRPPSGDPEIEVSRDFVDVDKATTDETIPIPVEPLPEIPPDSVPATPPDPWPTLVHLTLPGAAVLGATGTPVLAVTRRPYRQVFTIFSPHDIATVQASYDQAFKEPDYISMSWSGLQIPVFPGQVLYLRQNSIQDLDVSFGVEPRGEGR